MMAFRSGASSDQCLIWWIRRIPNAAPGIDGSWRELLSRYNGFYMGHTAERQLALTFDVGDGNAMVPVLLDMLKQLDVKATFFVVGKWVEANPGVFARVVEDGHVIGNHSYSHPDMSTLSAEQAAQEISRTDDLIVEHGGKRSRFFRPPFGYISEVVLNKVCSMGYCTVFWSISMRDWELMEREQLIHGVTDYLHDGAVVLLHVTREGTHALYSTVPQITARGYELVTLDQLTKTVGRAAVPTFEWARRIFRQGFSLR